MSDPRPLLIGNKWVQTAETQPVVNPYDQSVIGHVCQAGPSEVHEAIEQAWSAFAQLKTMPTYVKAQALERISCTIAARREEFAGTIVREAGKPITDARREVDRAIHTFRIAAEESKRIPGEVISLDVVPGAERHSGVVKRFPIGPILGITPFNFPLNLVAHKVAPALAAGNPILVKPAPQTPLTALLLGEVIINTDLPSGAVSILPCSNAVAETLVQDSRLKALSFTGSAQVGWMLKQLCGKKRVVLELGGNAGVLVEPDCALDYVVQRCVAGGFGYSGQTCISVQRIFVHESICAEFLSMLVDRVRRLPVGDPFKEETVVGPLINEAAAERVEKWIHEAVEQGAHIAAGGTRRGAFVDPTVLTYVSREMKVSCCEVFGPVVTVSSYQRFDEALEALNDSDYGLQAGIFTNDLRKAFQAFDELETGAVLINQIPTFRADHMPYGGVKDSGLGREGVKYAIQELTEPKLLILHLP
ncbi:MAG: aldehyde dehydrogenase family protein [Nitrospirae bacterium]|nr:MAG: aldehyde dehydrogenase family protein [Nitrospirota bacterium]